MIDMYADDTTLSVCGTTAQEVEQKLTVALYEVMTWITKNDSFSILTKRVSW